MRIGGGAVSIADVTDRALRDLGFVRPFWLNEIRAGRGFVHSVRLAASVGNNGHVQLFNPAASGITVLVKRLSHSSGGAPLAHMTQHNTELTTDAGAGVNLLSGGGAAAAHLRSVDNSGVLGTIIGNHEIPATTPLLWFDDWFMELGEGEGLVAVNGSVNVSINATFFWIEL